MVDGGGTFPVEMFVDRKKPPEERQKKSVWERLPEGIDRITFIQKTIGRPLLQMMHAVRKLTNPLLFQGNLARKRYFEGWYFRHVSGDRKSVFALIPGVSLSSQGSTAPENRLAE